MALSGTAIQLIGKVDERLTSIAVVLGETSRADSIGRLQDRIHTVLRLPDAVSETGQRDLLCVCEQALWDTLDLCASGAPAQAQQDTIRAIHDFLRMTEPK